MSNDIEWKMIKLGDVCLMPTNTISTNSFDSKYYVGTENMLQNCFGIIDNEIQLTYGRVREYKNNDILMSNIRPYLKKIWFADKNAGCSTDVNIFRANSKYCHPKYLFHVLCQDDFFKFVNDNAVGTKMPRGDKKVIPTFKIPIPYKNGSPDLDTQSIIAQKLSDMDSLISAKEKLLAKKRNLKTAAMQKLIKDEESENWKKVNLQKSCTIKARIGWQGLRTEEYRTTGDIFLVTGVDFENGFVNWDTCFYVDNWRFSQDKNIQLRNGDILITKDGTIGKVAYVTGLSKPATLNSGVFVIRPKKDIEIDTQFLSLIFKSDIFNDFLEKITAGSTIVHLYQKDIVKFDFPLPDLTEQKRIASILSDMDSEISSIEKEITKLQNLKTAMMQKMFCFIKEDE